MSRFPFLGAAFVASALIATAPAEALVPVRGSLRAPAPLHPAVESTRVEKILYTFHAGLGGIAPVGGLVRDAAGALFGITQSGGKYGKGVVFMVAPPDARKTTWTETVIYDFGAPNGIGGPIYSGLTLDASGSLYGVTYRDGPGRPGVAFRLSPPAPGESTWTATTLHAFGAKGDGEYPDGSPFIGDGAVLGTTQYGGGGFAGIVFALTPPAGQGPWPETIAHAFTGPDGYYPTGGVIATTSGNVFGTAFFGGSGSGSGCINSSCGTAFELTPAGSGPWGFTLLHSFGGPDGANPSAPLLSTPSGTLFGTTQAGGVMGPNCTYHSAGCGVVFELTPPPAGQTNWTQSVVHAFVGGTDGDNPFTSGVIADSHGFLYGTTVAGGSSCGYGGLGCGVAYKLAPPAPGKTQWTESVIHVFGSGSDGQDPAGGLVIDPSGALYGETSAGGTNNDGIIYEMK